MGRHDAFLVFLSGGIRSIGLDIIDSGLVWSFSLSSYLLSLVYSSFKEHRFSNSGNVDLVSGVVSLPFDR